MFVAAATSTGAKACRRKWTQLSLYVGIRSHLSVFPSREGYGLKKKKTFHKNKIFLRILRSFAFECIDCYFEKINVMFL